MVCFLPAYGCREIWLHWGSLPPGAARQGAAPLQHDVCLYPATGQGRSPARGEKQWDPRVSMRVQPGRWQRAAWGCGIGMGAMILAPQHAHPAIHRDCVCPATHPCCRKVGACAYRGAKARPICLNWQVLCLSSSCKMIP